MYALISCYYIFFCNKVLELSADIPNSRAAACYSNLGITEVNNGFYCVGVTPFLEQTRNGLRWNPSAHFRAAFSDIFKDAPSLHVLPRSNNVTRRLATGDRQFWPRQIPFWRCRNDPINAIAFYDLSSRHEGGLFLLSNRELAQFVSPSGVYCLSFRDYWQKKINEGWSVTKYEKYIYLSDAQKHK